MAGFSIKNGCLKINLSLAAYKDHEEFFKWFFKNNNSDGSITRVILTGHTRLTHLIAFIEQIGLLLERKESITTFCIDTYVTKPTAEGHRKLRHLFDDYTGLTSFTVRSPYIISSIILTEKQYKTVTLLDIGLTTLKWITTIQLFTNLTHLTIRDTDVVYTPDNRLPTDTIRPIINTIRRLTALHISISFFKLLEREIEPMPSSTTLEEVTLTGINSTDTLAVFFSKLTNLKLVHLNIQHYSEVLTMLNNNPQLVDVTVHGRSILSMYVGLKYQLLCPFFETMIQNKSERAFELRLGEKSYERLRELIALGMKIDKVAYPVNYPIALKLVEHGYKLDPHCLIRVVYSPKITLHQFKHRCKLIKHFKEPYDIKDLTQELPKEYMDVIKIDL